MMRPAGRKPDPIIFQAIEALKSNRPAEAVSLLHNLCKTNTRDPQLWFLLSSAYSQQGNTPEVIRCTQQVLRMLPHHVGALCNLGGAYAVSGQQQQATHCFEKALQLAPRDPGVHLSLAEAMSMAGHNDGAISHFQAALRLKPDLAHAHKRLGQLYWLQGAIDLAEKHYKEACRLDPFDGSTLNSYILAVFHEGRIEAARRLLDKALVDFPGDTEMLSTKAQILEREGLYDEAFETVVEIERQGAMSPLSATTYALLCRRFDCCDKALDIVDRLLVQPGLDAISKQALHFAAGTVLDKLTRYDEAFAHFRRANEAVPLHYDHDVHERFITSLIDTFSVAKFCGLPRASNSDQRPIFIVGMPRSGTSLTEQILASHPEVYGAGELRGIKKLVDRLQEGGGKGYPAGVADLTPAGMDALAAEYLKTMDSLAPQAARITDKMPHNFQGLGLIARLFPKATIIHCRRNPLDTCLSIYFMSSSQGHAYAADLENLGRYYLQYERLMHHWETVLDIPILNLQYEELVANQEEWTRKILNHCGLSWHDACLNFHETKRTVSTPSYGQVRKKMYSGSVARWRNYEAHIEPLLRVLGLSPSGHRPRC